MDEKNFISRDQISKELQDYKEFIFSSNLIAMSLSLLSAQVIQKFVSTISETVFMPIIKYFMGKTDGNWRNIIFIPVEGMELEIGKLFASGLEFFITITLVYVVYSKIVKKINPDIKI